MRESVDGRDGEREVVVPSGDVTLTFFVFSLMVECGLFLLGIVFVREIKRK